MRIFSIRFSGKLDTEHSLDCLQRFEHGADFGDFVSAEEVGFSQGGENSEEGFGGAHFFTKVFEGVGQRVANWPAEGA